MNRRVVKLELIAEQIIHFLWRTWGLVIFLFLIYSHWSTIHEYKLLLSIPTTIIYVIIYIWFLKILNLKAQNTKRYLAILNKRKYIYQEETLLTKIKKNILMIVLIFEILWAMIWFTIVLMFFAVYLTLGLSCIDDGYVNAFRDFCCVSAITIPLFLFLSFSIFDTISTIRKLYENKSLNLLNKICLVSSYLPILYLIFVHYYNRY